MTLPYENATSGDAALGEIRKVLTKFGCDLHCAQWVIAQGSEKRGYEKWPL